jgi:glycerophosphoryl diester phosphodiesterase
MSSSNRSWPYPRRLAHRGGGSLAPENTLAAIETGHRYGFRAVEFDVMLSADEVPVLIHDDTLERTTNGRGKVCETRAADLLRLDAGSWHSPAFAGEPLPSFEAAARLCRALGMWMNIEIKPSPGFERQTGRIVALAAARLAAERTDGVPAPLLSSFSPEALAAAREAAPHLARGYLISRVPPDWRNRLQALDCAALHVNHRHLPPAAAAAAKQAGYGLFCYTVDDPQRVDTLFSWGVDALCTDRIDLVAAD